jgi:plasmanylethanolamine desaturase
MAQVPHGIEQRSATTLREGYSAGVRRFELASIAVYTAIMVWLAARLAPGCAESPWLALTAFMLGYVAADFVSGVVHWAADTWGTPEWPVVGKALIRPFREHHVDQYEITRHDFVETNGNNCFISIVPGLLAALLPQGPGRVNNFFAATFVFSLILWVLLTNQFHKWSHLDAPPKAIDLLQRWHLILPRDHHQVHHTPPYAKYYCITVGWLNEPLHRLHFFPAMEKLVSAVTGLVPREDDIGKRAALALVERQAAAGKAAPVAEPLAKRPQA